MFGIKYEKNIHLIWLELVVKKFKMFEYCWFLIKIDQAAAARRRIRIIIIIKLWRWRNLMWKLRKFIKFLRRIIANSNIFKFIIWILFIFFLFNLIKYVLFFFFNFFYI